MQVRKFFVVEEKVCSLCNGMAMVSNGSYHKAVINSLGRKPEFDLRALEEIYGPPNIPCPNNCELGMVYERVPLPEALHEVHSRLKK